MKTRKRFESRWFAMAVICLALAVLFSGCPTDGSSSSSSNNNSNNNDVVSGVPYNYTLSDIWRSLASGLGRWDSNCRRYNARFEREQNPAIYQLRFGVTNRSVPTFDMFWDIFNIFDIGGRANYPFYDVNRISLGRNAEGDVTWVIRNGGPSGGMHSRGVIRFDYYESEIRRVMFYVEDFRFGGRHHPQFVRGLNNNTWLYRRRH